MEKKKRKEEEVVLDVDSIQEEVLYEIPKEIKEYNEVNKVTDVRSSEDGLVSCLRNERVVARWIARNLDKYPNPKHVLSGGIAEGVYKSFTVPILSSGVYVNVLTDKEKAFLEYTLGLERNGLSIYKKENNFWDNFMVALGKEDNYFDLRIPMDYIKYKVLLANSELICPNLDTLVSKPKASYKFVLFTEGEEDRKNKKALTSTMEAYKEFGKYEEDKYTLKTILEIIQQKPISPNTKLDWIQNQINASIQQNAKLFLSVVKDEFLLQKVLIKRGVDAGIISNRGGFYYVKRDNTPLCNSGEDPNLSNAAKYLALPRNQELKFSIEAELNKE